MSIHHDQKHKEIKICPPTSSKTLNRGGILFHQMPHCKHKENGMEEGRNDGGWKENLATIQFWGIPLSPVETKWNILMTMNTQYQPLN